MALKIQIDAAKIAEQFKEFAVEVEQDIRLAVKQLSLEARGRVEKRVNKELHSSRNIYLNNFGWAEVSQDIYVVYLDQPALWIEEGQQAHDMKEDLLKGKKYRVIPFRYDKNPQDNTAFTQSLVDTVKRELRKNNVPFKKIEYNQDGSPKVGKLHEFNILSRKNGTYIAAPGKGNTPALMRLTVYQKKDVNTGKVRRDILTFRTVTAGQTDKWQHPGNEAKKYMDEAADWAMNQWETVILPQITKKWE